MVAYIKHLATITLNKISIPNIIARSAIHKKAEERQGREAKSALTCSDYLQMPVYERDNQELM